MAKVYAFSNSAYFILSTNRLIKLKSKKNKIAQ